MCSWGRDGQTDLGIPRTNVLFSHALLSDVLFVANTVTTALYRPEWLGIVDITKVFRVTLAKN